MIRRYYAPYRRDMNFKYRISKEITDRTVVVIRDLFDATVSGFLYHKTGHECWLDEDGIPNADTSHPNDWLLHLDWQKYVLSLIHI